MPEESPSIFPRPLVNTDTMLFPYLPAKFSNATFTRSDHSFKRMINDDIILKDDARLIDDYITKNYNTSVQHNALNNNTQFWDNDRLGDVINPSNP